MKALSQLGKLLPVIKMEVDGKTVYVECYRNSMMLWWCSG